MQLSANHTLHLLDSLLLEEVTRFVDLDSLGEVERRLAFALARLEGTTDEQMLAWSKELIRSALHRLADGYGQASDVEALDLRHLNAICRRHDPAERHD
jgi:hypothetical protein